MKTGLTRITVGDRVWIDCDAEKVIRTVLRLTPQQIVVDWPYGDKQRRFERGKPSRYDDEKTYYQIGYHGWRASKIIGIATKAECVEWDEKQLDNLRQRNAQAEEQKREEVLRDELQGLFGKRKVSVGKAHHHKNAQWHVELWLTKEGVRKLPSLLEALSIEELPSWEQE